jgi:mRNA interferase MazF
MRSIYIARLDKDRPVVVLTRELVRPHLGRVTVAPISKTIRGISTEVHVGTQNGLSAPSVITCDNVATIPKESLGEHVGVLLDSQEPHLSAAIRIAFDLE